MAKKEEDVGKRLKNLESEVKNLASQKVKSTSEQITGLEDQVDYVKQIAGFQEKIAALNAETAKSRQKENDLVAKLSAELKKSNQIEQEILEKKQLIQDYSKSGKNAMVSALKIQLQTLDAQKNQAKQAAMLVQSEIASINASKQQLDLSVAQTNKLIEQAEAESKKTKAQRETEKILEGINEKREIQEKLTKEIADYEDQIKNATGENAEYVKRILAEKIKEAKNAKDVVDSQIEFVSLSEAQLKSREKVLKYEKEISESIGDSLGFLDKISDTISDIPIVGGLLSKVLGVDDLKKKLTEDLTKSAIKAGASFNTAFASAGGGIKGMAGGIKAMIPSIMSMGATLYASLAPILPILLAITAAVMLVKKALDMDKEVTEMARNLGMSKDEAHEIHNELLNVAETTKVVGASGEALGKAYQDVAKSLGVSKMATAEMAETQVYLEKQLGMSTEHAADFQKMSMAGGKSAYQNLAVIEAGVKSMTGGLMNYKEVASDIATSSKAVQASYKGNIAALTKAVVTAKKFGMTLDETKKSADAILDIESSLEAEMKANVLTGKNMNLNAARELALKGDTAGAMEEMMQQAGGYDELMKMAPYQQKAVAEAMGMTTEEMIQAAETQQNMESIATDVGVALGENGQYTEEQLAAAVAMGNKEAEKLAMQNQVNDATEKMSALGDKLMATFGKLAEPLMALIDPIVEIVEFLFPAIGPLLKFAFAPLTAVFDLFSGLKKILSGDILGGLKDIGAAIIEFFFKPWKLGYDLLVGFFPSIGKMVDDAMGWVKDKIKGLLPNWALKLLGMGGEEDKSKAAEPATAEGSVKVGDALIRPGMPPVEFDKDDIVMAGTNLLGESSAGSTNTAAAAPVGSNPMSEIAGLLKELIAKVDQPVRLTIGSKAIDEIETQTSMKRSFTTKADRSYGAFS